MYVYLPRTYWCGGVVVAGLISLHSGGLDRLRNMHVKIDSHRPLKSRAGHWQGCVEKSVDVILVSGEDKPRLLIKSAPLLPTCLAVKSSYIDTGIPYLRYSPRATHSTSRTTRIQLLWEYRTAISQTKKLINYSGISLDIRFQLSQIATTTSLMNAH